MSGFWSRSIERENSIRREAATCPVRRRRQIAFLDEKENFLDNPYMLIWRVVNNIDATRDIFFDGKTICIDATTKSEVDGFMREWPDDVTCTKSVLDSLKMRKIVGYGDQQKLKQKFWRKGGYPR